MSSSTIGHVGTTKGAPTVQKLDHSLADLFGPADYIGTYYPDIEDVDALMPIQNMVRSMYKTASAVDISQLAKKTKKSHELIENLAIFDFQNEVARLLIGAYPSGDVEVLDVGGGPTIYQHIAMSLSANHITHLEYLPQNRAEVIRWLRNESTCHNWDNYFSLMQAILRADDVYVQIINSQRQDSRRSIAAHATMIHNLLNSDSVETFKHRVRTAIDENVIYGDVFQGDLGIADNVARLYDVVTANFVVESATNNMQDWKAGMSNMMRRVKSGGFFIQTAIKNAEWYQIGSKQLAAVKVTERDLTDTCEKRGFTVLQCRTLNGSDSVRVGYEGMIFLVAQKN